MPGKEELEQIGLIFALRGAPTEGTWPGVSRLPHVASGAVKLGVRGRGDLHERFFDWGADALAFLEDLLGYDPAQRLSARQAQGHPYLRSRPLPQAAGLMPTWPTRHGPAGSGAGALLEQKEEPSHAAKRPRL